MGATLDAFKVDFARSTCLVGHAGASPKHSQNHKPNKTQKEKSMRINVSKQTTRTGTPGYRRLSLLGSAALLTLAWLSAPAKDKTDKADHYLQTNLVSDQPGVAIRQDTDLVNAWGMSFHATSPFWISDNGTGKATLYAVTNDASGNVHVDKQGLVVNIPGEGNPTGQLFNGTGKFHGDNFIFASEDGTISGWRGALGTNAEVLATRPTAVYKGIALATNSSGPVLLA